MLHKVVKKSQYTYNKQVLDTLITWTHNKKKHRRENINALRDLYYTADDIDKEGNFIKANHRHWTEFRIILWNAMSEWYKICGQIAEYDQQYKVEKSKTKGRGEILQNLKYYNLGEGFGSSSDRTDEQAINAFNFIQQYIKEEESKWKREDDESIERAIVFTDASAKIDIFPDITGFGCCIMYEKNNKWEIEMFGSVIRGDITHGEKIALREANKFVETHCKNHQTMYFTDSENTFNYYMITPNLNEIGNKYVGTLKDSKSKILRIPSHIGIRGNEIADRIAGEVLNRYIRLRKKKIIYHIDYRFEMNWKWYVNNKEKGDIRKQKEQKEKIQRNKERKRTKERRGGGDRGGNSSIPPSLPPPPPSKDLTS